MMLFFLIGEFFHHAVALNDADPCMHATQAPDLHDDLLLHLSTYHAAMLIFDGSCMHATSAADRQGAVQFNGCFAAVPITLFVCCM